MTISAYQLGLLHHTLGLRPDQREAYRNHFVAGHGHHDMLDLEALEQAGMMGRGRTQKFCDPGDVVFCCTDAGKKYAIDNLPFPPLLTKNKAKYREYAEYSECYDSFAHFLGINKPVYEVERGISWSRERGYKFTYSYRMVRFSRDQYGTQGYVSGDYKPTKKAAKASYKEALKQSKVRKDWI